MSVANGTYNAACHGGTQERDDGSNDSFIAAQFDEHDEARDEWPIHDSLFTGLQEEHLGVAVFGQTVCNHAASSSTYQRSRVSRSIQFMVGVDDVPPTMI